MKNALRVTAAIALAALASPALASLTTYTSSAPFLAALNPGYYTETFTALPLDGGGNPPSNYSNGTFGYTVNAASGLFTLGTDLGTNLPDETLTISFTTGNVRAVGGNFYATDINPDFQPVQMTITLSTGDIETWTPATLADSFRGFISDALITSLVISAPGQSLYATIDDLTVGTVPGPGTVPEPGTWALAAAGLAVLFVRRRRAA